MLWFSQTVLFIICTITLDQDKITPFESVSLVITMCQTAFLKVKCVQIRFWMTHCMLWCHSSNWRSDIYVDAHKLLTSLWLYTLGCLPRKQGCNTKGNGMQINVDLRVGGNDTPLPMSKHSLFVHTCNCQLNSQGFTFKACLLKLSVVVQMLNLSLCSQKGEN